MTTFTLFFSSTGFEPRAQVNIRAVKSGGTLTN
jgi:hypothetical protein